ncbi:histidine kinase [Skermanella stibiiresistens SB22]|uniref:histidine kinase n=1 Tax=Skermanella stibiiresistens SB22 TaxID=1385369 RepID=W9H8R2_9PROT|nr:histidine kinase [Skermanella stibiiresistens SB22]
MRSLRGRLLALWILLLASAGSTGFLLVEFYRQSATVQVAQAETAVARACQDITDRYAFFTAGWARPAVVDADPALKADLVLVVQSALARSLGVEGGIWQARSGSLAYAYPTYEGTGPKSDLPAAELSAISRINNDALDSERPVGLRRAGQSQTLVLQACPLPPPIRDATAWAMTRAFTGQGPAFNQLLAGLALLTVTVLGSALFLGRLLLIFSRRIAVLEQTLATHDQNAHEWGKGDLPVLERTGERELDRLVDALNATGQRLADARRRASTAERLAAVGRLLAGMAHEIRNPIAAMRLKAENALASHDPERGRGALTAILDQIARLDGLLRDLLALTQHREPRREPVDIASLLSLCANLHRDLAEAKGIVVEVVIDAAIQAGDERPCLDAGQIARCLDNLVLNAIQTIPEGGGTIQLGAFRNGETLLLRVSDTGPGVRDDLRQHLFEPFVTGRADGTGLGLAITREIALAHGGDARLVKTGRGATFEIELPWQPS